MLIAGYKAVSMLSLDALPLCFIDLYSLCFNSKQIPTLYIVSSYFSFPMHPSSQSSFPSLFRLVLWCFCSIHTEQWLAELHQRPSLILSLCSSCFNAGRIRSVKEKAPANRQPPRFAPSRRRSVLNASQPEQNGTVIHRHRP